MERFSWLVAGLLALSSLVVQPRLQPANAQDVVIVKEQPPVPRVEVLTPASGPEYFWIPGYWSWQNR